MLLMQLFGFTMILQTVYTEIHTSHVYRNPHLTVFTEIHTFCCFHGNPYILLCSQKSTHLSVYRDPHVLLFSDIHTYCAVFTKIHTSSCVCRNSHILLFSQKLTHLVVFAEIHTTSMHAAKITRICIHCLSDNFFVKSANMSNISLAQLICCLTITRSWGYGTDCCSPEDISVFGVVTGSGVYL